MKNLASPLNQKTFERRLFFPKNDMSLTWTLCAAKPGENIFEGSFSNEKPIWDGKPFKGCLLIYGEQTGI